MRAESAGDAQRAGAGALEISADAQQREASITPERPRPPKPAVPYDMDELRSDVIALGESLRTVITRQDRYERGLTVNSFAAYVLFTLLLGGAFLVVYRVRVGHVVAEQKRAVAAKEASDQQLKVSQALVSAREDAGRQAGALWVLLEKGRKEEAIRKWREISTLPVSDVERQFFDQAIGKVRSEIVEAGYVEGVEAFKYHQFARALPAFKKAVTYEPQGPRSVLLHYYYGVSLHKNGEHERAIRHLVPAIAAGVERTVGQDARYYLGACYEALTQFPKAKIEFEKFLATYPRNALAGSGRRRLSRLDEHLTP